MYSVGNHSLSLLIPVAGTENRRDHPANVGISILRFLCSRWLLTECTTRVNITVSQVMTYAILIGYENGGIHGVP